MVPRTRFKGPLYERARLSTRGRAIAKQYGHSMKPFEFFGVGGPVLGALWTGGNPIKTQGMAFCRKCGAEIRLQVEADTPVYGTALVSRCPYKPLAEVD